MLVLACFSVAVVMLAGYRSPEESAVLERPEKPIGLRKKKETRGNPDRTDTTSNPRFRAELGQRIRDLQKELAKTKGSVKSLGRTTRGLQADHGAAAVFDATSLSGRLVMLDSLAGTSEAKKSRKKALLLVSEALNKARTIELATRIEHEANVIFGLANLLKSWSTFGPELSVLSRDLATRIDRQLVSLIRASRPGAGSVLIREVLIATLPFDGAKLKEGLIRGAESKTRLALEFLHYNGPIDSARVSATTNAVRRVGLDDSRIVDAMIRLLEWPEPMGLNENDFFTDFRVREEAMKYLKKLRHPQAKALSPFLESAKRRYKKKIAGVARRPRTSK